MKIFKNEYDIAADKLNYTLKQRSYQTNKETGEKEEVYTPIAYFTNIESLFKYLRDKLIKDKSEASQKKAFKTEEILQLIKSCNEELLQEVRKIDIIEVEIEKFRTSKSEE